MAGDFALAARRLAGVASVAWGWSPDAFWRATPDEVAALFEAMTGGAEDAGVPLDGDMLARLRERYPDG
ncbi:phage tail assembly chaperone [uncultured Sphingomonas sp.]|uniref:phage tail assembly chaperone n=1 Tax=uncultured Sphingomonas sp. TaxID=158754 RepID=UPI0025DD1EC8|nr:phage tail assembly chaperone [uncultured Sphingomonas sp.]